VTVDVLRAHPFFQEKLSSTYTEQDRRKYRTEVMTEDEIEFYMMPNNAADVQHRLDGIRRKMPKFICINDDVRGVPDPNVFSVLGGFYHSYFPKPCPFELPPGRENEAQYIDDIVRIRTQRGAPLPPGTVELMRATEARTAAETAAPGTAALPKTTVAATITAAPVPAPASAATQSRAGARAWALLLLVAAAVAVLAGFYCCCVRGTGERRQSDRFR
jgi:hypothetical protein